MAELLYRLGVGSSKRAWTVILAWALVLAIAGGGFALGFRGLASTFDIPGMPSSDVIEEMQDQLPEYAGNAGTIVVQSETGQALTAAQQSAITALADDLRGLDDVAQVVDPFQAEQDRADAVAEIAAGQDAIAAGIAELDAGQTALNSGRAQLESGLDQIDATLAAAAAAGLPPEALLELTTQQSALTAQLGELDARQAELDAGRGELDDQTASLEQATQLLEFSAPIRVVSEDGSTAVINMTFTATRLEIDQHSMQAVVEYIGDHPIDGTVIGISSEISQTVPQIIGVAEVIGILIAAIVMGVMLRTLVGAMIPLVTALTGVAVTVLTSLAFSGVVQMSVVTPVLGIMLGLAVGLDYSLFIINRHRRQLKAGLDLTESIGLANGTSGNAVVFAGSTVVIALLALNVTNIPFLGLMGIVGAVAVIVSVLIAVTLTPALLGMAGIRILSKSERAHRESDSPASLPPKPMSWVRAIATVLVAAAALLAVAIPALQMRTGLPDGGSEAHDSAAYLAYSITEEQFGAGANSPILVTARLDPSLDEAQVVDAQWQIATEIMDLPNTTAVAPAAVSDDGSMAVFQVIPDEGPNSESTAELIGDLRTMGDHSQWQLGVAGQAAMNIDLSDRLGSVLPTYLLVVVGLSLLIMVVVFRSLLVPIIATGGFILSLFATYGAITAVFQLGVGADLIGLQSTGPILNFLPIILVGILFGLAMDYQIFLATGMREAYVHGVEARQAVVQGFRSARSVVIAAGLIMLAVFGGFVFAENTMIRSLGFGLAVGILFDAFVVRLLLMPALMHLLGKSAWWLPKWLDRTIPNVDVEGAALERRHGAVH